MDLTRALQRAVRDFPHGTEALAASLGMSVTTLNHKASPTYATQFFSPEEALAVQQETGKHYKLQAEALALGYTLLKMPDADAAHDACAAALLSTIKEFADFTQRVTTAAQACDGRAGHQARIKSNDMVSIQKEALEAIAAITAVVAWCQSRAAVVDA